MKTITQEQRLQLIGLLALAEHHMRALEDIKKSAIRITGESDAHGHTEDAVYDPFRCDADNLLQRLNVKVKGKLP